ncbi:mannan polymerase II complex MNN10 subunit [Cladophialophora psammophila CBS 110553]|uniref:Mannan polymerase II complex MNN10 subunit n=1 Tax=Cladophialophora psammophila CBS 110553 TaxID=1182543 RepID=W9XAC3_9EURO|nr:mannan polymerase II complex MNN10 subunit [Cladophialophora psammophila CBS 110553]EXJ67369.1 mannan polymerase II complex MNN10 subunit [Cladophialophora psammophila CBS 110553]
MSHSRAVSPLPNRGWNAPGLIERGLTPNGLYAGANNYSNNDDQWAAAKARSAQVKGYPSVQTRNEGFFQRSKRKISSTLPVFSPYTPLSANWKDPEKLGRSRWYPRGGGSLARIKTFAGNVLRRFKFLFIILSIVTLTTVVLSQTNVLSKYRGNSHLGGGSKFVIILGANEGGGVMEWKGPREWAIERDSVRNKKRYAERWGYILDIADMSTKKRYAHEWRESWEKVDLIRNAMARYPKAEWFWWLDLNTFIMEPSKSLQSHIFNNLDRNVYRDINVYNPLDIVHPPVTEFLDPVARSPTGDNLTSSIDIIIPQDCDGFNLGSFFVRRSPFTDRLLDLWWDPVLYEQKHMEWEHKEQDALEHLYASQPYLRTHFAFIPQRKVNSFPPGACALHPEQDQVVQDGKPLLDPRFHYNEQERDFMVNMAGCEWGRDCWAEMYMYRELSNRLNRSWWERFKDLTSDKWANLKKTLLQEKTAASQTG